MTPIRRPSRTPSRPTIRATSSKSCLARGPVGAWRARSTAFDVAAMSRPAKDSEAEQGIQYMEFGTSVTTIITHPGGCDRSDRRAGDGYFHGRITNWSAVGGPDLEIVVYVRDPEESNTSDIREAFVGENEFVAASQVMTSQTDMQNVLVSVEGANATALGHGVAKRRQWSVWSSTGRVSTTLLNPHWGDGHWVSG